MVERIKLEFLNASGEKLAGLLEMPPPGTPAARYALFAHCFTCGKDIAAASRISRALARRGIAVLRFDFTGLGNSDGDFANTNFSSNVTDLLAAAQALEQQYRPPSLLIGHSLGGAAVLAAAPQLPSVEAVVTIGAPATAAHVKHLFSSAHTELQEVGEAEVRIGNRSFQIKRQLLDDLENYGDASHLRRLGRALLVFHSPVDRIVSVDGDRISHRYQSSAESRVERVGEFYGLKDPLTAKTETAFVFNCYDAPNESTAMARIDDGPWRPMPRFAAPSPVTAGLTMPHHFRLVADTTTLGSGRHNITVRVTAPDGTTMTASGPFDID